MPRPGKRLAEPLELLPGPRAEDGEVDDERAEAHRDDLLDRDRAGERAVLPAEAVQALAEDLEEPGVGVDDGDAQRRAAGGRRPDGPCRGERWSMSS